MGVFLVDFQVGALLALLVYEDFWDTGLGDIPAPSTGQRDRPRMSVSKPHHKDIEGHTELFFYSMHLTCLVAYASNDRNN